MSNDGINRRNIKKYVAGLQKEFNKHPVRIPVETEGPTRPAESLRIAGQTVHNYNGPVVIGNGNQLAWNSQNVDQTQKIASDFKYLAEIVVELLKQLPHVGLNDEIRGDTEITAKEVLEEVTQAEPDRGKVRRAVAALKGLLLPLTTGATAGTVLAAQEWAKNMIAALS